LADRFELKLEGSDSFYYLPLSKQIYSGSDGIDPKEAEVLEKNREKFKLEIIKIVDSFL